MTLPDLFFILFAGITLVGALLAVGLKNTFHNALGLILALFGVAGLFIFLNAEFLAVMEVIIYIGAISIAIIFAIMLSQPMFTRTDKRQPNKVLRSIFVSILVFFGVWKAVSSTTWPSAVVEGDYSMRAIGHAFLTSAILPFEAVSVVLLIAIIGALVISGLKETAK